MSNNTITIFLGVLVAVLLLFVFKSERWQGFYYPNGCLSCSENYIYSPVFKDKESCFDWGNNLKYDRKNPNDTFECGKNCHEEGEGMYICKETVD